MAEAFCACTVANIEGTRTIALPYGDELNSTLEGLDRRTRVLEHRFNLTPPPPMLDSSWDSLTWRVCRLARLRRGNALTTPLPFQSVATLSLLKSVITSMDAQPQFTWPEKEGLEKREAMGRAVQWLCHYAGQRGFQVESIPFELGPVCSLALNLSLEEEPQLPWHRPYTGASVRPPRAMHPARHPPRSIKQCCGCCSCSCHESRRRGRSASSDGSSRSGRGRYAKWPVFGWVKKLAFWRKKPVADDASSVTTL
ncbi:hypothetical protein F4819DRAFT_349266 [Hypoxylon fuscum]|nr:hypothetical protein F4819DRAFT_349266 [Hypoxylon fuscum]